MNGWMISCDRRDSGSGTDTADKDEKMYKAAGGTVAFPVKILLDFPDRAWYNPKLRRYTLHPVEKWVENAAFHWDI